MRVVIITNDVGLKSAIEAHKKMLVERAGLLELTVNSELPSNNNDIMLEEKIQKISFKLVVRNKFC